MSGIGGVVSLSILILLSPEAYGLRELRPSIRGLSEADMRRTSTLKCMLHDEADMMRTEGCQKDDGNRPSETRTLGQSEDCSMTA